MKKRPERQLKVLLLGASFSTRNMGVGALTAAAVKCLKYSHPASEVMLLDYGKRPEFHELRLSGASALVELVNLRFSKRLFLPNNVAFLILAAALSRLLPHSLRLRLYGRNPYLRKIHEADMAASIAGGDSLSDIYGIGRFIYVALPQVLVLLMGKRLIQLPQTFGPFRSRLARLAAGQILARSEVVYSRDYQGLIEAREAMGFRAGARSSVRFCFDMGFVLDPCAPEAQFDPSPFKAAEDGRTVVGLNVSGLLYMGGYTGENMFGLKLDYRELVRELIDFLAAKKRAKVVLIPHVFGGPEHAESDSAVSEAIYNELKESYGDSLSFVSGRYDQGEIKHIIGLCDFFIGSRMHACIAALSQGVPAVPVAYSRKFLGVMETIGAEQYVADPCRHDIKGVIEIVDRAFEERKAFAAALKERMPVVKEAVLELFADESGPR